MPRCFVALPVRASSELADLLRVLDSHAGRTLVVRGMPRGGRLKPVPADRLHLTLRFFADLPDDRLPAVETAISHAVRDAGVPPFNLQLRGLAQFPAAGPTPPRARLRQPPRVVFVGIEDTEPVLRLGAALDAALEALDPPIPPERRPLLPHLTVARLAPPASGRRNAAHVPHVKDAPTLESVLGPFDGRDFGGVDVDALHLVESRLLPSGPVYTTLHAEPLR